MQLCLVFWTLHLRGHTIRTLGSTDPADDSDDSDSSSSSSNSGNGDKSAGGGGDSSQGKQQEEKSDAAQEEETTQDELQVGEEGESSAACALACCNRLCSVSEAACHLGRTQSRSCEGCAAARTLAACALLMLWHGTARHAMLCRAVCCTPQVRFLDVASAITALARTAGEQLTVNLKKWSPAGGFGSTHAQDNTAQHTCTRAVTGDAHVCVLIWHTLTVHAPLFFNAAQRTASQLS